MIAARILLALAAVALLTGALARGADAGACDDARREIFAATATSLREDTPIPAARADDLGARLLDRCRGSEPLAAGAQALVRAGALDTAGLLARTAVARDPEHFLGFYALARVLDAEGRPAAAAAARARARRLNPLAPVLRTPADG